MSNPEHDKFGTRCGESRWFNGTPEVTEQEVRTFELHWWCPIEDCDGQMRFNGFTWPTGDPGYHHTCNDCGFTAAIRGRRYPCTMTRPLPKGGTS